MAAIALLLVAACAYVALLRPGTRGGAGPAVAAGALGTAMPDEGRAHVAEGTAVTYRNTPPTSGAHFPAPAPWGVSDRPIAPGYFVHNLEHSGVVVLYDCPSGCPDVVATLTNAYDTFPKDKYGEVKLLVTPYSGLPEGARVAALAWDYRLLFTGAVDVQMLRAFYNAHVDKNCPPTGPFVNCGPEDVP